MAEADEAHVIPPPADASAAFESGEGAARRLRRRPHGRLRRACLAATAFLASVAFLILIGGGLFFARLTQGPLALDLVPQIKAALDGRVGHGYAFRLGGTTVEATEHGPALTIERLSVVDSSDTPIVSAPRAAIAVDPLALLTGTISPRQLRVEDMDLRLMILPDGEVALAAGTGSAALPLSRAFSAQAAPPPGGGPTMNAAGFLPSPIEGSAALPTAEFTRSRTVPDPAAPGNAALQALAATLRSLIDATTGPDTALASLDNVQANGRLILDDRARGSTTEFSNAQLSFEKGDDGSALLQVSADGSAGRWTVAARAAQAPDGSKTLTVEVDDLSLDEITLAGNLRDVGFDFDMPVSGTAAVRLAADDTIQQATGSFRLGGGYFKLDDPDHEPLLVDSLSGGFHLDPRSRDVVIDATRLKAGESDFSLTGRLALPRAAGDPWTVTARASGLFGAERPGEKAIRIANADMAFRFMPLDHAIAIDRISITGPEVDFHSAGELRVDGSHVKLDSTSTVGRMPVRSLVRLWPSTMAAQVRAWFLANLRGTDGTVESGKAVVALDEKDFAAMRQMRSVADDHLRVDYTVSGLALNVLDGLPPLTGLVGSGIVTGNSSAFTASRGELELSPGHKISLADGTFRAPDTDPKPTPATVDLHLLGTLDAVADLLGRDALKPYASLPLDPSTVRGQVDARVALALKLGQHVPPEETKVSASATITDLAADKLVGKEGLTGATLQLAVDRTGFRARGEGQIFGAPATIDLRRPSPGAPSEAVVTLALDNAARARAGINLGKQLTGVVNAKVVATLGGGDRKSPANVELDLTKAAIDGVLPGFSKSAGKPSKASLSIVSHEGGGVSLDNIVFDGGGASVRGSADLDGGGGFQSAKLTQVKLSPGDDLRLDVGKSGDTLKLVARGANFDARPFLKWLGGSGPGGGSETGDASRNVDVELHTGLLTGQNNQAISGVDLRLSRRNGQLRSLQMGGRLGKAPITVGTVQQGGNPVLTIQSSDAGGCLAFMDLYKRMSGGRLDVALSVLPGKLVGSAHVRDFALREDPAIKRLATEGLAAQTRSGNVAGDFDTSSLSFSKLEARFTKVGTTITVQDGALSGQQAGATVSGNIDLARDQVSLQGTFVPLFGINNLFSQVPLFGPILGGGKHEGLFGINYRITGSASQPVMSINPLSAVAPGFLRDVFGALGDAAQPAGRAGARDSAPGPSAEIPQSPFELGQ